jgi:carbon monoxide dehydrogenase subunit G
MQIELETIIAAPPAAVFSTLAAVGNWAQFMSGIDSVEMLTPGAIAAGTRFRETRTMFGKTAIEEMTVVEIAPPNRLLLTAFNHGTAYRVDHKLATATDGTRLSLQFSGTPVTLIARIFAPLGLLFAGSVRKQIEKDLADFKREAERRHRSGLE